MKLTISEIADAIGVAPRIVQLRAKDWDFGVKREKGKGLCYSLDALFSSDIPDKWVDALQARFLDCDRVSTNVDIAAAVIDYDTKAQPLEKIEQLPSDDHIADANNMVEIQVYEPEFEAVACEISEESDDDLRLNARYEILKLWAKSVESCVAAGGSKLGCDSIFVEKVKSGAIAIPDWVRKGISSNKGKIKLSRALLFQWKDLANAGSAALRPKFKGKEGQGFFDSRPEYVTVAEALCREFGASARLVHYGFTSGLVKDDFDLEEIPTEAQVSLWLKKREQQNHQRTRAFATGDMKVLKSGMGSYSRGLQPNDKWEADSTKADLVTKKDGVIWLQSRLGEAPVRCAIVGCIDVATRYLKFLVCPTSNGEAIASVIAACIREWGLPKVLKTDNGKDYKGRLIAGFCNAMNIEQVFCGVKMPEQKGHIERVIKTLQHSSAWEMLPWNTGHNVAQQQAYRKRREGEKVLAWTIEQFQNWLDLWGDNYHNTVHSMLGCTPNERLASFRADGFVALMPKNLEKNLEFALLLEDLCTVNKQGIKYQGRFYIASELIGEIGKQVAIRFNPENPNQIYVYSSKDLTVATLICIATWDMALSPEEQAKIASTKPVVSEAIRKHEEEVKKARRNLKSSIAKNPEKLLPSRGGVAALRATEQIETASSNLIQEIESAVAPKAKPQDPEMDERWKAVIAKREEDAKPSEILVRTPEDWLAWWDKPELANDEDLQWMIRTAGMAGYGKAWLTMRRVDVDDAIEILEGRLRDRAA